MRKLLCYILIVLVLAIGFLGCGEKKKLKESNMKIVNAVLETTDSYLDGELTAKQALSDLVDIGNIDRSIESANDLDISLIVGEIEGIGACLIIGDKDDDILSQRNYLARLVGAKERE